MTEVMTVLVWLDESPLYVPWHTVSSYEARGALGVRRGVAVCREVGETGEPDGKLLAFDGGHQFNQDDRYLTVGAEALGMLGQPGPEPADWWKR